MSATIAVEWLAGAAGATRLVAAADGSGVLAELGGAWRVEAFDRFADEVPPLTLRLDRAGRALAVASGWALTAPGAGGSGLVIAEADEEYRYAIRALDGDGAGTLVPPVGTWALRGALAGDGHGVVVLWRPAAAGGEELWLAAVDGARRAVVSERRLVASALRRGGVRVGEGLAMDARDGTVYLAEAPAGGVDAVMVHAFAGHTLAARWTCTLPRPDGIPGVLIAPSGDGRRLLVIAGRGGRDGVTATSASIVDAASGAELVRLDAETTRGLWTVAALAPAQGSQVAVVSVVSSRVGAGRVTSLERVALIDTAFGAVTDLVRPETIADDAARLRARGEIPGAVAWLRDRLVLAPPASAAEGVRGLERPEVRGLVATPASWHRADRAAVARFHARG